MEILAGIIGLLVGMIIMSHIVKTNDKNARNIIKRQTLLFDMAKQALCNEVEILEKMLLLCPDSGTQKLLKQRIYNLNTIIKAL